MADMFVIQPGSVVEVQVDPAVVDVVTVAGPKGDTGPSGPSYDGVAWFFGEGPPGVIIGSKPLDRYMDVSDGTVYTLGGDN